MLLADVIATVADACRTVARLQVIEYPADTIPAGAADVVTIGLGELGQNYTEASGRGMAQVWLTLKVHVQASDAKACYLRMHDLLSAGAGADRSIVDALEAQRLADQGVTPHGALYGLVVESCSQPSMEPVDGTGRLLVCDITVSMPLDRR